MKKFILTLGFCCLLAAESASAATWKIEDNYIGGIFQSNYAQKGGDVISLSNEVNKFDVDNMIVDIDNLGNVKITITTDYLDGTRTTHYGDLFISADGWSPLGTSPFILDTYFTTGTDWEYVFDTSTGNFYSTADGAFILSEDIYGGDPDSWYRKNQVVQYNTTHLNTPSLTTGSFERTKDANGNNILVYYGFNLSDMGLDLTQSHELAFRWSMTCANDIIEGGVTWNPVPEPGTMLLLGLGLIGLGTWGRKRLDRRR